MPRPTCRLHIVGVTGFRMDDRALRRAGLDYWPEVKLTRHRRSRRALRITTRKRGSFISPPKPTAFTPTGSFEPDDCLVFGRETRGLPEDLLRANWENCLKIPMLNPNVRSLNLATAVGIVLFEALRQTGKFPLKSVAKSQCNERKTFET